ncbi:MAG: hypothetical protein H6707_14915 [Deltaproteobacteria bacterium]|nr:hypothetical protein [Deltaproteobacteria bacterium]
MNSPADALGLLPLLKRLLSGNAEHLRGFSCGRPRNEPVKKRLRISAGEIRFGAATCNLPRAITHRERCRLLALLHKYDVSNLFAAHAHKRLITTAIYSIVNGFYRHVLLLPVPRGEALAEGEDRLALLLALCELQTGGWLEGGPLFSRGALSGDPTYSYETLVAIEGYLNSTVRTHLPPTPEESLRQLFCSSATKLKSSYQRGLVLVG